jgi:uncharacterized membrane protein
MPTMISVGFTPLVLTFYNKLLAKNKFKKVDLMAVIQKLMVLAFDVLKSGKPIDVSYQH